MNVTMIGALVCRRKNSVVWDEILTNKKGAYIAVSPFRIWCQWSDSNRHALRAPDFESGASTNSATLASGAHSNDLNPAVKH